MPWKSIKPFALRSWQVTFTYETRKYAMNNSFQKRAQSKLLVFWIASILLAVYYAFITKSRNAFFTEMIQIIYLLQALRT